MAMMRLSEAEAAIHRLLTRSVEAETVSLAGAEGCFMAQDLIAPADLPPHGN